MLRRITKSNVASNYLITLTNLSLPVFILPVLTRSFTDTDFGNFAIFQVLASYSLVIVDFGLSSFGVAHVLSSDKDKFISNSIILRLILAIIATVIYFGLSRIGFVEFGDLGVGGFSLISIGYAIFPLWYLNGLEKSYIISLYYLASRYLLTICFVYFTFTYRQIYLSVFLFSLSIFIPCLISFIRSLKTGSFLFVVPSLRGIQEIVYKGLAIAVSGISGIIYNGSLVIIVKLLYGPELSGRVLIVDRIVRGVLGIFSPAVSSLLPKTIKKFNTSERTGIGYLVSRASLFISAHIFLGIVIYGFKDSVFSFFGKNDDVVFAMFVPIYIWSSFSLLNNFIGLQFFLGIGRASIYSLIFNFCGIILLLYMFAVGNRFGYVATMYGYVFSEVLFSAICIFMIIAFLRRNNV